MPPELKDGLQYVKQSLNGVMNRPNKGRSPGQFKWRNECANFAGAFGRLVVLSKE